MEYPHSRLMPLQLLRPEGQSFRPFCGGLALAFSACPSGGVITLTQHENEGHKSVIANVAITPKMIEAGVYALFDFGGAEDLQATDPALIVSQIFCAMQRAAPVDRPLAPQPTGRPSRSQL